MLNATLAKSPAVGRTRFALAAVLIGLCTPLSAHDFWIQPQSYRPRPDAPTPLTLQVGHGPDRQRSAIGLRRILRFAASSADGRRIDLRDRLQPGGEDDGRFSLPEGSYQLLLETDARAESHLPAIRFNDYLRAEGLTPALQHRQRNALMATDGSENYSRCSKAIVQVGAADAASPDWLNRPLGLPLEIVLERSPYARPRPARLPLRVIYQGRPLPGALVKLTRLEDDAAPVDMQRTDADGRTSFATPERGNWLLNVIWTRPLPAPSETDYATVFSSLSFGFADAR
ncbi:MAG: DUF4198 domain-containing protein [Lysobacter sp.]